ncbi:MAG: DUF2169 domain-containing protein [Polyangiaceae bacterium]
MTRRAPTGLWPVRCAPVGPVAVGSVLWRHGGELHCTAVVKASLELVPQGVMPLLNPSPIRRADDYLHGRPSLAGASEVAPRMLCADVTVVGHAYAQQPVEKRAIRLVLVRGDRVLIDKTLYVYGDRKAGERPRPFTKMRIGYERALGGLSFAKNPVGIGLDDDSSRRPNVLHAKKPKEKVGGFGPIPARFLQRRQLRRDVALERMADGIADYPPDFDWSYFQAAPRDQRVARLAGDEWLMLEGLHPEHERIRARLPKVRALCRIYTARSLAVPEMVELEATMLHIEPDDDRCSLIWRGHFPVVSELLTQEIVLAGAVQCGDEPLHWPGSMDELEVYASPKASVSQFPGSLDDSLQRTAISPRAADHLPDRRLGGGYRLGEQNIQLSAARPAAADEPPPAVHVEQVAAERRPPPPPRRRPPMAAPMGPAPSPPPWPPPGPPPHGGSGVYEAASGVAPGAEIPPAASWPGMPPTTQAPSYPGMPPTTQAPSWPGAVAPGPPTTHGPYPVPAPTQRGHQSPDAWSKPKPPRSDLSSTDEMEDPDGDAAADAGLAPNVPAETRHLAVGELEGTRLITDADAEAVAEIDHPFAFTHVHVDVDE